MNADDRAQLYLQHPEPCPDIVGALPYLIHPPGRLSRTSSWLRFRDETLVPLMRQRPDDTNLAAFLRQAEAVLVWRAGLCPEQHFWRAEWPGISGLGP